MMNYSYEIVRVDEAARVMEVVYTAEGRQTMHIGARLPYEGESLQAVVEMYSPVSYWLEQEMVLAPVEAGVKGEVVAPQEDSSLDGAKYRKRTEIAARRYEFEVSGIRVSGVPIATDRTAQSAIMGVYSAVKNGLITSADWKASDGQWLTLSAEKIEAIAQSVADHVQNAFSLEKQLADVISAAETIEEVEAVKWPQ